MTSSNGTPVLWQLRLSHFNEKARWALDHKQVPHVRRTAVPGFHIATAMRLNRQQTMPILTLDGTTIGDSAEIIDALEARNPEAPLYPQDPAERAQALELERFFDVEVGPEVRRILIFHMLDERPETMRDAWLQSAGAAKAAAYKGMFPVMKVAMRRSMDLTPDAVERSKPKVMAALDRIEAELGEGEYLVGGSFSLADLTAASLLAPILRPPEFPYELAAIPPGLEAFRDELTARPASGWVFETWRRHRPDSAEVPA
jgi:glutathione S-transferase